MWRKFWYKDAKLAQQKSAEIVRIIETDDVELKTSNIIHSQNGFIGNCYGTESGKRYKEWCWQHANPKFRP